MRRIQITMGLLLVISVGIADCAAVRVAGRWREQPVTVDGNDREWQGAPQYYDDDRQFVIRVSNDAQAVYLCVATSDSILQRQLRMAGMTIWLDPEGAKAQVFGIHLLPGGDAPTLHRVSRSEGDSLRPPQRLKQEQPSGGMTTEGGRTGQPPGPHAVAPLTDVAITYADTTGPLTMNMEEVRRTGIDIGVGRPDGKRLVYEFRIDFKSAPSLAGLGPGMMLGVGIRAGSGEGGSHGDGMSMLSGPGESINWGPGPGGGRGGGPGGPGPGEKADMFNIWLQFQLAGRASG